MPSSSTVKFIPPLHDALSTYNRHIPATSQPPQIPRAFLDAMHIRERVFVQEQQVPLSMEADADDPRSAHWVAYSASGPDCKSTEIAEPAGTIRLVPFPHDAHPLPGSSWDLPEESELATTESNDVGLAPEAHRGWVVDRATSLHDGREAYLKLGRWAVKPEHRGHGIAGTLVRAALAWATERPQYFDQRVEGVPAEMTTWNGLLCVHAQEYVKDAWAKLGFVEDVGMGNWTEAGIPHVGMFLRIDVTKTQ